jgi:hypothetical protein
MQFGGGTETRTYNPIGPLTGIAGGCANVNIAYLFAATTNNGRAASMTFNGETVTHTYASLNRLVQASSNQGWVEDYGHDRYGNLTSKGRQSIGVDQSTTRLISGFYDANWNYGAAKGWEYDIENRLTKYTNNSSPDQNYGYDAGNKRVWKRDVVGSSTAEQISFYEGGERLGTYEIQWQPLGGGVYEMRLVVREANFYYGGRLLRSRTDFGASGDPGWVMLDRLGSVVSRGSSLKKYRPYGDESADPYKASAGAEDPRSWNQYTYVQGDPVNFNDPTGEFLVSVEGGSCGGVFIIPGLVFSVWKLIFGGAPKNPVAEAWRTNPGAQVAAWDRRIADANREGEEQDKRFVAALRVVGDCYTEGPFGGTWVRRFQYQPVDQHGVAFARGQVSVTETKVVVQGGSLIGNSTWIPNKMNADGSFFDYVGKTSRHVKDIVQYQTFTATMLNPDGLMPGVPRAVMVDYPGYKGGQFGTMGHWITNDGVRTNDYWFHPEKGRQICPDEPRMRFQ